MVVAGGLLARRALAQPGGGEKRGPIAFFPPVNLSGTIAPMNDVAALLEAALRDRGVLLAPPAAVSEFLARHRVRYTGGLAPDVAASIHDELGAAGVLVAALTSYQQDPPRIGIELRVVSAEDDPRIVWADGAARAGDDSPGLLDLGTVREMKKLEERVFRELAGSLADWQRGGLSRGKACAAAGRFSPKVAFRAPALDASGAKSIAVLPFVNQTGRRNAGEVVALHFVRQLFAGGRFQVVEPGVLRDELLRFRIVMEGGLSLDTARVVAELSRADLVLAGYVGAYRDAPSAAVAPAVQFTVQLLDRKNSEVLWESTSDSRGDDGVFFFDAGKVSTVDGLTCRMARTIADLLSEKRSAAPRRALSP